MKILTIVGARPQFVKAATVSRVIHEYSDIEEVIVHTGQHFDKNMSDIFFEEMKIPKPNYNLNINSLGHGAMTGRMLEGIEEILQKEKPSWVLVYGDTNSTLAGALAASKLHIKVAHVEAGLRSFNMKMPEEINRILTDRISNILFCPTSKAIENLTKEGFSNIDCKISNIGDVMQDAAIFYEKYATPPKIDIPKAFILATIHRAANTNDKKNLSNIVEAFNEINEETPIILPLHPRTKNSLEKYKLKPNFKLVNPVSYLEMVYLLKHSNMVITDSGGVQKEAYFFNKPCITIREQTEWVELIENGVNMLAKASSKDDILSKFQIMKNKQVQSSLNLYGKGDAANKIIETLLRYEK